MKVNQAAFRAVPGGTVNITAGTSSANVQIEAALTSEHVRVYNASTETVFIEFGNSSVTASLTTSIPIAPDEVDVFALAGTYIAVIAAAAASAPVYFTPGEGMD